MHHPKHTSFRFLYIFVQHGTRGVVYLQYSVRVSLKLHCCRGTYLTEISTFSRNAYVPCWWTENEHSLFNETIILTQYLTIYDRHHTQADESHMKRGEKSGVTLGSHTLRYQGRISLCSERRLKTCSVHAQFYCV
jgi:hypothetical protein